MRDIRYCAHSGCYEDCDLNIMNVDDESVVGFAEDYYGSPGCRLYDIENVGEDDTNVER